MIDNTNDIINDEDLLSLLSDDEDENTDSTSTTEVEDILSKSEDDLEAERKMQEIREMSKALSGTVESTRNIGSGDLDTDVNNWFDGKDTIPSDPLGRYVSNPSLKMDYGLTRNTLSNFKLMSRLRGFLNDTFDMLFDNSVVIGLDPDELEDRVKLGFAMYKELSTLNNRTILSLKDYRLKSNSESDEMDRLKLLLSSIPTDKLEGLLREALDSGSGNE